MTGLITKSIKVATQYHKGQMYGDKDYFHHLSEVVQILKCNMKIKDDPYLIVGYLHDILEDTTCSLEDLEKWFGKDIADAVNLLTKHEGYDYFEYIEAIKTNDMALAVKKADTFANLTNSFNDGNVKRIKRYTTQLALLCS